MESPKTKNKIAILAKMGLVRTPYYGNYFITVTVEYSNSGKTFCHERDWSVLVTIRGSRSRVTWMSRGTASHQEAHDGDSMPRS